MISTGRCSCSRTSITGRMPEHIKLPANLASL
jgi:hypothetical protein